MEVVRNYYSTPITFAQVAFIPQMGGAAAIDPRSYKQSERVTVSAIWNKKTAMVKFGSTVCSLQDRFERKVGREIAQKRAKNDPICEVPDIQTYEEFRQIVIEVGQQIELEFLGTKYNKWFNAALESPETEE